MERSIGGHATEASQMCRKGKINDRMSALEAAYEEYRLIRQLYLFRLKVETHGKSS